MGTYNEPALTMQINMVIVAMVLTYFVFTKASDRVNTLMKLFLSLNWKMIRLRQRDV